MVEVVGVELVFHLLLLEDLEDAEAVEDLLDHLVDQEEQEIRLHIHHHKEGMEQMEEDLEVPVPLQGQEEEQEEMRIEMQLGYGLLVKQLLLFLILQFPLHMEHPNQMTTED